MDNDLKKIFAVFFVLFAMLIIIAISEKYFSCTVF